LIEKLQNLEREKKLEAKMTYIGGILKYGNIFDNYTIVS